MSHPASYLGANKFLVPYFTPLLNEVGTYSIEAGPRAEEFDTELILRPFRCSALKGALAAMHLQDVLCTSSVAGGIWATAVCEESLKERF